MSITNSSCKRGCCVLKMVEWRGDVSETKSRRCSRKSGVVIYDSATSEILLVQSRGNLWGMPKGTLDVGEDSKSGAIREAYEETGIELTASDLGDSFVLGSATYYMVPFTKTEVSLQIQDGKNDASGIGWVRLACVDEMLRNNKIKLTHHANIIVSKINFTI